MDSRERREQKTFTLQSFSILTFFFILSSFLFSSCPNPLIAKVIDRKTATFETNGGSHVASQTLYKNYPIKRPADPVRSGWTFNSWYIDNKTFLEQWDFNAIPTGDITLYAKWDEEKIQSAAITVPVPLIGAMPGAASGAGNFTIGAVLWTPDDIPFMPSTAYSAEVTLTANESFIFADDFTATINGQAAVVSNNTGWTVELFYQFKATGAVVAAPDIVEIGAASVTLAVVDAPDNGQSVEYGVNTSYTAPASGWQSSTTFSGLEEGTLYYFFARSASNDDYEAGPPSDGMSVTTMITIHSAAITAPVPLAGNTPGMASGEGNFTIEAVLWTPADNPFNPSTVYSVELMLTAYEGYLFPDDFTATINGQAATVLNKTDTSAWLQYQFKATGAVVDAPSAAQVGVTSVTLAAIAAPATGQSVEYGISTYNTAPFDGWQSGTTFSGLTALTTYYFFARSAANNNYEAGVPSAGTSITTKQQAIVEYWVDENEEISIGTWGQPLPDNTVPLQYGDSVTFSAGGSGYLNHNWTLNGIIVGTYEYYTFDTSDNDKEPGRNYIIGLMVQLNGKPYFTQITVRVEE